MAKVPVIYRDIDLSFMPHPVTGDVSSKTNASAIVQSIRTLVLTGSEEFLWSPDMGGDVSKLLFKLNTGIMRYDLQKRIETTIKNYEKRCELKEVEVRVSKDMKIVQVIVSFFILNIDTPFTETITLTRTR